MASLHSRSPSSPVLPLALFAVLSSASLATEELPLIPNPACREVEPPYPEPCRRFLEENDAVLFWVPSLQTPDGIFMYSRVYIAEPPHEEKELQAGVRGFLERYPELFGDGKHLIDAGAVKLSTSRDEWKVFFFQYAGGIPIEGASLGVIVRPDGSIASIEGTIMRDPPEEGWEFISLDSIRLLLESWGLTVEEAEKTVIFPKGKIENLTPAWKVFDIDYKRFYFHYRTGRPLYPTRHTFMRGDADMDGKTDLLDAIHMLNAMYGDGAPVPCRSALDVNTDGGVSLIDAVVLLRFIFVGDVRVYPPLSCGDDSLPPERAPGCTWTPCWP